MISSFRPFLVTFLVLLQFIAPLVHAHTREKIVSQGLHIPGLEAYGRSASQESFDATATALPCKVSSFCGNVEGQIVGVNAGISRNATLQRLYKIIADLDHDTYLPPPIAVFQIGVVAFTTTLSKPTAPLICQLVYFAHSPRAPPAHA